MSVIDGELAGLIDGVFADWDSAVSPGCALGIYLGGEIVYSRGYGMSNMEHDVPITPDSIFHVASISKQFAAHCVVLLAQEGELSLEDDVREYLPELPDYGPTITIQHLIHHTSGLRDQWELLRLAGWREDDLITDDDVLEIAVRQRELNFQPSDQYFYSNTGYTFLGLIIKRVTGLSLRQLAHERIFQPLGMTRTHFHDDHSEIVPDRTQAYQPRKDGVGYRISIPVFDTTGATSLHTTVEDLFRWHHYLLGFLAGGANEAYLQTAVLNDGEELKYGCGLRHDERHGLETVGHAGADAGYRAHFINVPEQRLGIAILCNLSTLQPAGLVDAVLRILVERGVVAGDIEAEPEIIDLPERELAARAGIYRGLRTGAIQEIVVADGRLQLPGELALAPTAEDRFTSEEYFGVDVRFSDDPETGAVRMEIREVDTFERVAASAVEPDDLAAYAGVFHSDELGVDYELLVEDGELQWKQRRFDARPLKPVLEDTFVANGRWIAFTRDDDGSFDGFSVSSMRARRMRFERVADA